MILLAIGIGVAIVSLVAGDYLLKKGAAEIKTPPIDSFGGVKGLFNPSNLFEFIRESRIFHWRFSLGIAVLGVYFGAYLLAMKSANVTLVVPLMSMTHVLNTLVGKYRLHERVTLLRWSGVALVVLGVILMVLFHKSGAPV